MPAWLWTPASGNGPGTVLLQEIFGISAYIRRRAAALADAGYVVLAPELYWRLDGPDVTPMDESAPDAVETAMNRAMSLDWDTTVADSVAALEHLRSLEELNGGVGIVGFCLGGGIGFNVAAMTDPDCLVSYYGSSIPHLLELAPQVTAPSLHHFGLNDDYIDAETVTRIRAAVTAENDRVKVDTYEGANHAFDNDDFYNWNAEASARAWRRTLDFLSAHLGTKTEGS